MNVQKEEQYANDSAEELYNRYRRRNDIYHESTEFTDQESREILTRTIAPDSYRISGAAPESVEKYRNGNDGGRRYMTSGDFAAYYNRKREYTPEPNADLGSAISVQRAGANGHAGKNGESIKEIVSEKRRKAEFIKNLEKNSMRPEYIVKRNKIFAVKKNDEAAFDDYAGKSSKYTRQTSFGDNKDKEKKDRPSEKKVGLPRSVLLSIIVIAASIILIAGSILVLATAKKEKSDLFNSNINKSIGLCNTLDIGASEILPNVPSVIFINSQM